MMGKTEAVATLRRLGLDQTPIATYVTAADLDPETLERDLGAGKRYVARASSPHAALNLPRLLNATANEVCRWAAQLAPGLGVIVQEYGELAFCGQLAVYPGLLLFEIVSGMWEMRAGQQPYGMTGTWTSDDAVQWTGSCGPVGTQICTWLYEPESALGQVEDWMISVTQHWVTASTPALRELLAMNRNAPYGLKFHYTPHSGVAAQNLYSDVPAPADVRRSDVPDDCPVVRGVHDPVPEAASVLLEVSVCREDAALFDGLVARLRRAGTTRVYIRSGLLSHAAIRLREAGFDVTAAG